MKEDEEVFTEEFWRQEFERSLAVLTNLGFKVEILEPIRLADCKVSETP